MSREITVDDSYPDKIKKLIPAEVGAAFLAINNLIPIGADNRSSGFAIVVVVILVLICAAYLRIFERVGSWLQVAFISGVAFPIWALNIAANRFVFLDGRHYLLSILLIFLTLVSPLLIRGNEGPPPVRSASR